MAKPNQHQLTGEILQAPFLLWAVKNQLSLLIV